MNARQKAHAHLQHALDALGDGSGHDVWGPGPVGHKLWLKYWENYEDALGQAARAFDQAAQVAYCIIGGGVVDELSGEHKARLIRNMNKLAPVILDAIFEAMGVE